MKHVKAHVGIQGNEAADELAKKATQLPQITDKLPIPPTYIKRVLHHKSITNWEQEWRSTDKGRHSFQFLQKPLYKEVPQTRASTSFLTGHGPYPAYLHGFHLRRTPTCPCGEEETAPHYYFDCSLAATFYLRRP